MAGSNGSERVRFQETQHMRQPWLWAIIILVTGLTLGIAIWNAVNEDESLSGTLVLFAVGLAIPAFILFIRLQVTVTERAVLVSYRPFTRRQISFDEIAGATPRTYRPVREYGGWGLRGTRKNRAYTVDGDQGVYLELRDGRTVLIGSRRPRELAAAINR